ncbi:MAG: hypothetical protein ACI4PM_03715 [Butyricicoccus sp.]
MARRKKKTQSDEVRTILQEYSPEAAQCLCDMLSDETLSGTTKVSVAKEILERAVGKGQLSESKPEDKSTEFTLVLKVVE